jgi:putative spermidine/putrescine transport system permease protein
MWSNVRGDFDPTIAAIATLCFVFALLALLLEVVLRRT